MRQPFRAINPLRSLGRISTTKSKKKKKKNSTHCVFSTFTKCSREVLSVEWGVCESERGREGRASGEKRGKRREGKGYEVLHAFRNLLSELRMT
jgi:hypothetical protein